MSDTTGKQFLSESDYDKYAIIQWYNYAMVQIYNA